MMTLENQSDGTSRLGPDSRISVIIPCFNAESYIVPAIESVLRQGWQNLEILVVDDGSSDQSVDRVRESYPELLVLQQQNQDAAAARNAGLARASGEWIAFLDADELWLPGKLQAQLAALSQSSDARMSYTSWDVWESTDPRPTPAYLADLDRRSDQVARWSGATGWIYPDLLLDSVVWTSTVLLHRSVIDEIGPFDPNLRIGEDYDLWLRASRITPIIRVPRPYALYRTHPVSTTKSAAAENYRNIVVGRAIERWGYSAADGRQVNRYEVSRAFAESWADFAGTHLECGNRARAMAAAASAVRADPSYLKGWKLLARALLPPRSSTRRTVSAR